MATDKYSSDELNQLEIMTNDLIIGIFQSVDKRYVMNKMLKKAFDMGKDAKRGN